MKHVAAPKLSVPCSAPGSPVLSTNGAEGPPPQRHYRGTVAELLPEMPKVGKL